jgi:hypothetical protein
VQGRNPKRGGPDGPNEDCKDARVGCKAHLESLRVERIASEELEEIRVE